MKRTLSERLTSYLQGIHPRWVASGELQKLTIEKAGQTGRTCVRRLQELAEEGVLEVEYRERNHAYYRAKSPAAPKQVFYVRHPVTGERITTEQFAAL